MRILDVLRDMGHAARMTGESDPADHSDYIARVETLSGPLPPWEVVSARRAELTQPTADHVRAEAGRRILALYPIHAQINMLARSSELLLIGTINWSADQRIEAGAMQRARDWIKAVRDASNALEQSPPADVTDDSHWPAAPT